MGAHSYTLYMWTNYVLLIGFTQPNRCNSQHNKNQRHRKFGLDVIVAASTCVCVRVYASYRTSHILYQPNRDMVWYTLGRHWGRRRLCLLCKVRNCSENQLSNSIQRACTLTLTLTHSNDTLKFTAIEGTALWKHIRRNREKECAWKRVKKGDVGSDGCVF